MSKLQMLLLVKSAAAGCIGGLMNEHESTLVAENLQKMSLDEYDAEDLTDLYEFIRSGLISRQRNLKALELREWKTFCDRIASIVERLNEPVGSPCRNIVLKSTRKRY